MNTREIKVQKQGWIPKKGTNMVNRGDYYRCFDNVLGFKGLLQLSLTTLHSRQFEHTFKSFGSIARMILFFVLAYYVLLRVIRLRMLKGRGKVKKWLSTLLGFARNSIPLQRLSP